MALPEYVSVCGFCKGVGEYLQRYIEGRMIGPCDLCRGAQWVYSATGEPVPESVRSQIATSERLTLGEFTVTGVRLYAPTPTPEEGQTAPGGG